MITPGRVLRVIAVDIITTVVLAPPFFAAEALWRILGARL